MELENARGWRPPEGETLIGEVVEVSKGWAEQAEKFYPIITIKPEQAVTVAKLDKDGKQHETERETTTENVAVHCFHAAIYNRIVELKPKPGERVGIKFVKGTVKNKHAKGGNTPSVYIVKVDGRQADVWEVMQQDSKTVQARQMNMRMERDIAPDADPHQAELPAVNEDDDIPF